MLRKGGQDRKHRGDDKRTVDDGWDFDPLAFGDECVRTHKEERELEEDFRPDQ